MINLRSSNDVLQGTVTIYDKSVLEGSFTRAFIALKELGLSKELNAGTDPTLSAFLSPSPVVGVEFEAKVDMRVTVEYTLLSLLDSSGLTFTVGDNIVSKTGIYNLFSGTNYIYIEKLYLIDKSKSTADSLWLTTPIEKTGVVYIAYYIEKCISVLYKIPERLKVLTFELDNCCGCRNAQTLSEAYRYMEALKIQADCNGCEELDSIFRELKDILNIC